MKLHVFTRVFIFLQVYIALEMAGHGDLLDYIKLRGALPEAKAQRMFFQLASAIEYLHKRNILHRLTTMTTFSSQFTPCSDY